MTDAEPLLTLEQPCHEAVDWVIRQASVAGLQVIRTFDLHDAHPQPAYGPCPHHGSETCDCQMVVLLMYGMDFQPISLVAYTHAGITTFSLVNNPQQRVDTRLDEFLRQSLHMAL